MAKLDDYRRYVQQVLEQYSRLKPAYGEVEQQLLCDPLHDHYQLVTVGWQQQQRVYSCVVHVDIRDSEIWIQHDSTEGGIAGDLVALGVPKEDIVLAFHAPYKRPYTGFGVGRAQTGQQAA
ncbi:MAG: XisI protein [Candidatus Binatia bacterium]